MSATVIGRNATWHGLAVVVVAVPSRGVITVRLTDGGPFPRVLGARRLGKGGRKGAVVRWTDLVLA